MRTNEEIVSSIMEGLDIAAVIYHDDIKTIEEPILSGLNEATAERDKEIDELRGDVLLRLNQIVNEYYVLVQKRNVELSELQMRIARMKDFHNLAF